MNQPKPLAELEVIGFADRLSENMLPQGVVAAYRAKDSGGFSVLLPTRQETAGCLPRSVVISIADWEGRVDAGEVTAFDGAQTFHGKPDHCLWIDCDEQPHYEPLPVALAHLDELSVGFLAESHERLLQGDDESAEKLAEHAFNANPKDIHPLIVLGVVRRRRGRERSVDRLAATARKLAPKIDFSAEVERLERLTLSSWLSERVQRANELRGSRRTDFAMNCAQEGAKKFKSHFSERQLENFAQEILGRDDEVLITDLDALKLLVAEPIVYRIPHCMIITGQTSVPAGGAKGGARTKAAGWKLRIESFMDGIHRSGEHHGGRLCQALMSEHDKAARAPVVRLEPRVPDRRLSRAVA